MGTLFAPKPGKEIRKDIKDTTKDFVEKGSGFSQLTAEQKDHILEMAAGLASVGSLSRNQIIDEVVEATSRGKETIRTILAEHEKQNPGALGLDRMSARLEPKDENTMVDGLCTELRWLEAQMLSRGLLQDEA